MIEFSKSKPDTRSVDERYTDGALGTCWPRKKVDIGEQYTISGITKFWTGVTWNTVADAPLPGDSKKPSSGDVGRDSYGNRTIYNGVEWLSVRETPTDTGDHFAVEDDDLHLLLNLAGDLVMGNGNMDSAILFGRILERVEARLGTVN